MVLNWFFLSEPAGTSIRAMQPRRFAFGRAEDAYQPDTIRAALAEFVATAIFVFAAEGSVLSLGKISNSMIE